MQIECQVRRITGGCVRREGAPPAPLSHARTIGELQWIALLTSLFREERDALAFLGLLSSLYLRFDPPISSANGGASQPTHFQGLNIHALIIDNVDGEVLALEHNQIHAHQSPVEHAEQRALRMAIARMGAKRPRAPATTVEHYYRTQMFYNDGAEDADFLQRGATIYTSLEPCPMCATTILVCRVKRTVFLLQDTTYGGVWVSAKNQYYKKDKLTYGQLSLSGASSPFILRVRDLHQTLSRRVDGVRNEKVIDTLAAQRPSVTGANVAGAFASRSLIASRMT